MLYLFAASEFAPTAIKLYCNLANPGFSDTDSHEAAQRIELDPEALSPDARIPLKVVKFQNVNK